MLFIVLLLFGFLSAVFALAFELLVTGAAPSLSLNNLAILSFQSALILLSIAFAEETSKYLFLRQYARRFFAEHRPRLREAVLLGAIFGIGFSLPEIFLLQYDTLTPPLLAFVGTISLHILTSIALATAILSFSGKRLSLFFVLAAAILFHLLYNAAVLFLFMVSTVF
jgi:hypothetical protein